MKEFARSKSLKSSRFVDQPVFLYNVACTYGRAVERLRQDRPDDPRIESGL
ncbi:MAG: hypothetical protein R3B90_11220 [Planctomycetaceae bacterium]